MDRFLGRVPCLIHLGPRRSVVCGRILDLPPWGPTARNRRPPPLCTVTGVQGRAERQVGYRIRSQPVELSAPVHYTGSLHPVHGRFPSRPGAPQRLAYRSDFPRRRASRGRPQRYPYTSEVNGLEVYKIFIEL